MINRIKKLSRHLEMTSKNENPRKSPKDPPMAPIISLVSYTRTSVSTLLTLFIKRKIFAWFFSIFVYVGSTISVLLSLKVGQSQQVIISVTVKSRTEARVTIQKSLWGCYKPRHVTNRDVFLFKNSKIGF